MIPNLNATMIYEFLGTAAIKNEKELFDFMYPNLSDIVYILYANSNFNTKYKNLFINPKFLSVLNQVLNVYETENRITEYMSIYVDSILYWYIVNESNDEYIRMLWYMIANTINREYVHKLKNLNILDSELCNFLAIANKSSLTEVIRIQNVHFTVCTSAARILSPEDFENIYKIFYLKSFKNLLLTILFDNSIPNVYYGKENTPEAQISLTNSMNAVTAVIKILESMNPFDINRYLKFIYNQYVEYNYDADRLRISLTELPRDKYPKIVVAIENLKKEKISIP